MHTVRAGTQAVQAADAAVFVKRQLGLFRFGFGIMAPKAAERAALQKNGRADPGAIVQGKPLYIKNSCRHSYLAWRNLPMISS
jgi:hypothetical protein